jgi:hypothetical protein
VPAPGLGGFNFARIGPPSPDGNVIAMKLPPDVKFRQDLHLLIFRGHGLLDKKEIDKVVHTIAELELTLKEPFNRFWDATGYHGADLSFKYATDISISRRLSTAGRPSIKSAVLATNPEVIHYTRLMAVLTQGSPIKVRLFEKREEAAKWLGVPLEVLLPAAGPATRDIRSGHEP